MEAWKKKKLEKKLRNMIKLSEQIIDESEHPPVQSNGIIVIRRRRGEKDKRIPLSKEAS
ncbi:MAG: hypothetical protein JW786_02705 [Desulfobacterales bacterium]|nr:hypothetical protein [Desulfobacterales bacterium]